MNLAAELTAADRRVQQRIDELHDRAQIHIRIEGQYARRSMAQRLRNDGREQRRIQAAHEWAISTGAPK